MGEKAGETAVRRLPVWGKGSEPQASLGPPTSTPGSPAATILSLGSNLQNLLQPQPHTEELPEEAAIRRGYVAGPTPSRASEGEAGAGVRVGEGGEGGRQ